MNINEMPAGYEMDAMIAEMEGYKAYEEKRGEWNLAVIQKPGEREPWKSGRMEYWESASKRYTKITCVEASRIGFYGVGFPRYSTNIADAWPLVEKLRMWLFPTCDVDKTYEWTVVIDGESWEDRICAETAPLAICRCALKRWEAEKI